MSKSGSGKGLSFSTVFSFIFYFFLFTGVGIGLFYYYKDTPFKRKILSFHTSQLKKRCPSSPQKELFQECIRSEISKLTKIASPYEVLDIPHVLESVYAQDKVEGETVLPRASMAFIINNLIFFEELEGFSVSRDKVDFFQIVMLPYFKWKLKKYGQSFKERAESLKNQIPEQSLKPIEKRYLSKLDNFKF